MSPPGSCSKSIVFALMVKRPKNYSAGADFQDFVMKMDLIYPDVSFNKFHKLKN